MPRWLPLGVCVGAMLLVAPGAGRAGCVADSIALDPSTWDSSHGEILGKAIGETFVAPESVLTSITVWRPPNNLSVIGAHLFVTTVDTTYNPPRPNTQGILRDGPTVTVYDSDPPGQLIEMKFVLDPPLVLSRRWGTTFAFLLQGADCYPGEAFILVLSDKNPYPGGVFWTTDRATCYLGAAYWWEDTWDLIFDLQFCASTTAVRRTSWGSVKTIYR